MAGYGLRIAGSSGMEGFTGNTENFPLSTSNTDPIFVGDPVVLSGGFIVKATSTTAAILGVFLGWEDMGVAGTYGIKGGQFKRHWSATDGASAATPMAKVALPIHGRFWIKGNSGVTFAAATSIGALHPWVDATGNSQYGDSRVALGAPGAGPLMVHRLVDIPGNAWGDTEPVLEVSVALQSATYADAS